MYRKHHTRGIILASKAESADSKRIYILTEQFGLISARVQGSRHTRSKLRSGCQDFSFGEFSLIHGKTGWKMVSGRSEQNFFESLKDSSNKLVVMGNVLSLIKKLVGEGDGNEVLFAVVANFLNFLVKQGEENLASAECLVLLRVLHLLGYVRDEPEFSIPLSSGEISPQFLAEISPRRARLVSLINESLKATHLT